MYCYFRDRNENIYSVNWPNRFLGSWVHTLPYSWKNCKRNIQPNRSFFKSFKKFESKKMTIIMIHSNVHQPEGDYLITNRLPNTKIKWYQIQTC